MSDYRIYDLSESGHILRGRDEQYENDDEALELAAPERLAPGGIEIWQATRMVGRRPGGGAGEKLALSIG